MPTHDAVRTRQARASQEGREFQLHVKNSLNAYFEANGNQIRILNDKEIFNDITLQELFLIPVRGFNKKWGDVDLVAKNLETNNPIALISCKTSLHGRFSETLFYSIVYKTRIPDLKVVFATPDKGKQDSDQWKSEWGTLIKPTKDRLLAETYLDGVYVDNDYLNRVMGLHGNTTLGGKIKAFSQLSSDIIQWSNL
jgi:hypothetical protein